MTGGAAALTAGIILFAIDGKTTGWTWIGGYEGAQNDGSIVWEDSPTDCAYKNWNSNEPREARAPYDPMPHGPPEVGVGVGVSTGGLVAVGVGVGVGVGGGVVPGTAKMLTSLTLLKVVVLLPWPR